MLEGSERCTPVQHIKPIIVVFLHIWGHLSLFMYVISFINFYMLNHRMFDSLLELDELYKQ